jgi:hypothetical protein
LPRRVRNDEPGEYAETAISPDLANKITYSNQALKHMKVYLFNERLSRTVSLHSVLRIFDNIYNLPFLISYYNFKSGIIIRTD